ncbi:uncharacterized protein Z518_03145 [Rhinocladiella mackenziei CBS 650.93]|uniref:Uncharacterized protein n=1 Tax=Rhinocladiella mackenziei CBS 650.93 TaxID=1442369 RepID=A0A0D2IRA6_9EURO|nr:uncharacterized protein Z518_03145 [Rhinocladiella mackenziei CBS 650.93]KIX08489.1 hypothetical protein Z518_03145 [Rhinocladiella mackenziei CBS 650.93]
MCFGFWPLKKSVKGSASPQISPKRKPSFHDPNEGLSELAVPPPIQNRSDSGIYRRYTLEESLSRVSRGEDPTPEEEEEQDILVRHHTLEENIDLARRLSRELKRQADDLRRHSSELSRKS